MSRAKDILEQLEVQSGLRFSVNTSRLKSVYQDVFPPGYPLEQRMAESQEFRFLGDMATGDVYYWQSRLSTHYGAAKLIRVRFSTSDTSHNVVPGFVTGTPGNFKIDFSWSREPYYQDEYDSIIKNPRFDSIVEKVMGTFGASRPSIAAIQLDSRQSWLQ